MPDTGRAIMLGIRHRCGQEVQFWIPADLVGMIARRLDEETEALGLAEWMQEEGILDDVEEAPSEALVQRLRTELAPEALDQLLGLRLIHVLEEPLVLHPFGEAQGLGPLVEALRDRPHEIGGDPELDLLAAAVADA